MSTTNETLEELVREAVEYINAKEPEQAKPLVEKVLELDPENLDGHLLAGTIAKHLSDEALEHYQFVLDRDIRRQPPMSLSYGHRDFVENFLFGLQMKWFSSKREGGDAELNAKIIHYSTRLLEAGRPIHSIDNFAEILYAAGRYDDVINLGRFACGECKGEELGWPGLDRLYDRDADDEIETLVVDAYFVSERHEDGCRWMFDRVRNDPENWYSWRLFGETLCWLGYPEEAARAWVISVQKGGHAEGARENFGELAHIVHDPAYGRKRDLSVRLYNLGRENEIPPEKRQIFEDLKRAVTNSAFGGGKNEPPTVAYIETKLGMKLPPFKRHVERLWLPVTKSRSPLVTEIIAFLDQEADAIFKDSGAANTPGAVAAAPAQQAREKVAVGAEAGLGPTQQGFALYQFGVDVTEQARKGDMPPIVGRDREIERMVRILARHEKNNPILLGEAGVGKTAIVHGLAQRIATDDVPPILKNRRVIELNMGVLVAGTTYRGDFEKRIRDIVKETQDNPDIILFIDELHTLIGAGAGGMAYDLDASNMIKPALANGELRLIGATTAQEFSRTIEKDPALERRFSPIWIKEIDAQMTLAVLRARCPRWNEHHGVLVDDELLQAAVQLTEQHVRHRHFPDKAIDLVDEACALARTEAAGSHAVAAVRGADAENSNGDSPAAEESHGQGPGDEAQPLRLTREHLQFVLDEWTGAAAKEPEAAGEQAGNYLDEILHQLQQHVVGHAQVLRRLSTVIADERLGLRVSSLPRVLLFAGRPNTGKTACGRAIAQLLWPDRKERFLRINMGLFTDPSYVTQLIGVPPGYAGSNESGQLSLQLRQHPHSILYLYNFHKAHERVLRLFANLFTDGSIPDARGQMIYAGNAIFILSVTIDELAKQIGFGTESTADEGETAVKDFLEKSNVPEDLIEAATEVFWFDSLGPAETKTLIRRQLDRIAARPSLRETKITFDDDLVEELARRYRRQPPSARNLQALLNQIAHPKIRQQLATD